MSGEHYFSPNPAADQRLKPVEFSVAGVPFNLQAASGTFSSTGLDKGTAVLLKLADQLPEDGTVLDLGCGWGPIGISIAKLAPATSVWGVDINARSVELANQNAASMQLENFQAVLPATLPEDLQFDQIWSNPPIRIGKQALHELLLSYLRRLKPSGRALLVVQKQLGAESLLRWLAEQFSDRRVQKIFSDKGYWVLEVASSPRSR